MRYLLLLLVLGGTGCATLKHGQYCDLIPDTYMPIIKPGYYGEDFFRTQLVKITSKQGEFEFIGQLEVKHGKLILVAMTPIGQKLFQIGYQAGDIHFDTFGMRLDFDPAYLLADLGLIYANEQAIRQCLQQPGVVLQAASISLQQREFIYRQSPLLIEYHGWNQSGHEQIVYQNKSLDYKIEIQTLEIERISK